MPKMTWDDITPLAMKAVDHWKEHRPKEYAYLKKLGTLYLEAQRAADQTWDEHEKLMEQGMRFEEAWELVREKYVYLPEEEGLDEEPPDSDSKKLMQETQAEFNKIMREHQEGINQQKSSEK